MAKQALEIKDSQIKNKRKSTDYNESGEVLFSPLPCGGYFNFGLFIRTLRLRLTKICEYPKNITQAESPVKNIFVFDHDQMF